MIGDIIFKDYGFKVVVQFRNGPEVACECLALKAEGGWLIDSIETDTSYREKGCATAILERIKEVSGWPTHPHAILGGAIGFWAKMRERGLCHQQPTRARDEL